MSARADRMLIAADKALRPIPPITVRPVNVMDETQFPNLAELRRHYASLSPERIAWLERNPL